MASAACTVAKRLKGGATSRHEGRPQGGLLQVNARRAANHGRAPSLLANNQSNKRESTRSRNARASSASCANHALHEPSRKQYPPASPSAISRPRNRTVVVEEQR